MLARSTRRRFLALGGASVGALAGCDLWTGSRRSPGAGGDRPNVVLIIVDTLRADHVFGPRARTPNIDALASEGLSFTRFYPEAMPTVPARRSILSGRRVFPFRGWHRYRGLLPEPGWAPLDDVGAAFTSVLRRAGYWTAYATDNTSLGFSPPYARFRASFDRFARRGGQIGGTAAGVSEAELRHWLPPALEDPDTRDRVLRYLANGRYSNDETRSFAARVFRDGADLLAAASGRRPFCLVVDTFEPHEPWTPPRKYVDLYGDPDYRGPEPAKPYYARVDRYLFGADREVLPARMRALYAAEVTMTDRWLGVFLDRLNELKLERDTVVMLVSDHGFYLGDHGLSGKSSTYLHPELIHVPLIVVDTDRRRAGEQTEYFASTHDIGPTLLAMAGVAAPRAMEGIDLSPLLAGGRPRERTHAWGGYGNSFFARDDRWALFGENAGGGLHLYETQRDRRETRNLAAARPGQAAELARLVRSRAGGGLPSYDS